MANLTRAEMIDRVLEHLGILAVGASVASNDSVLVGEAIDAAHERLRKYGLAPFATSAIPPWAQIPFRDYAAGDVAQTYGLGAERLGEFKAGQVAAEKELSRQLSGYRHPIPIRADYF